VINIFKNNPEALVIYGKAYYIDEQDSFLGHYAVEPWNYQRLLQDCYLCQPAVFFKRSVVEQFGLLNESFHYSMDYEYWLRCGKNIEFQYIPQVLAASRLYSTNKTLRNRPQVFYESSLAVKLHWGQVPDRWIVGYAFVKAETQRIASPVQGVDPIFRPGTDQAWVQTLDQTVRERSSRASSYDRIFFKAFLQASVKNYLFWKQWPSFWGIGKLVYWFFKCYFPMR
jgi:hypothetical protein